MATPRAGILALSPGEIELFYIITLSWLFFVHLAHESEVQHARNHLSRHEVILPGELPETKPRKLEM